MPKTKFQEIVFTLMMVFCMVYCMVCYNMALSMGGLSNKIFIMAFSEIPLMAVIAIVLEMFIAGPLAKKLAFRIVTPGKDPMLFIILAISAFTVCLMCPMMSFMATLFFKNAGSEIIAAWLQTTFMNFPVAFFWQIFFAGPFVRLVFRSIFERNAMSVSSENA